MDWKKLLAGAIVGAIGAVTADTHSASKSDEPWDWKIALKRAGAGAVTGATAAAGLGTVAQ
jgi:hypothetical protein